MIAFRDRFCRENKLELHRPHQRRRREAKASTRSTTAPRSTRHHEDRRRCCRRSSRHGFDAAFGGARRDEEKSRAKERIYSFRDRFQQWDPKNQRPELWNLYNAKVQQGREHPRLPAVELDRARRLAVHLPREDPDRAALLRRAAPGRRARRHAGHGRRRAHAAASRRECRDDGWCASARSAATRSSGAIESERDDAARDHPRDAADARTPSGRGGSSTTTRTASMETEEARGLLLMAMREQRAHRPATSSPTSRATKPRSCCASSPSAPSTTASRR